MIAKFAKRTTALVLSFLMLVTVFIPTPVKAAAGNTDDVKFTKSVDYDPTTNSGVITIDGYVEGEVVLDTITKTVPVDVILVLDQSYSMNYAPYRISGNLYSSIKGTAKQLYDNKNALYVYDGTSYHEVEKSYKNIPSTVYIKYNGYNNNSLSSNRYSDNLYHYDATKDTYHKLTVESRQTNLSIFNPHYRYTYSCDTCNKSWSSDDDAARDYPPIDIYYRETSTTQYTFTYEDSSGVSHSETLYANETPVNDYYILQNNPLRMEALQASAKSFVNTIAAEADKSGIHHRVAVISFAGSGTGGGRSYDGTAIYDNGVPTAYGAVNDATFAKAFKDVSTPEGVNNVNTSIEKLKGVKGYNTEPDQGFDLANKLWDYDDTHHYNGDGEDVERKRVIIFLTDGVPAPSDSNQFTASLADSAIAQANIAKASKEDGGNYSKIYAIRFMTYPANPTTAQKNEEANVNEFLKRVSSECSSANGINNSNANPVTWYSATAKPSTDDNTYFYKYSASISLDDIFEQIVLSVEKLLVDVTVNNTTIVRDIIAPEFNLPTPPPEKTSADLIEIYTSDYLGSGEWDTAVKRTDVKAAVADSTIELEGYDYNANFVSENPRTVNGKDYRGQKIIIKIPFEVEPSGFGGNHIETNGAGSGVIINGDETNTLPFNKPFADVPLDYKMKTQDQNIYYTGAVDFTKLITPYVDSANNEDYTADGKNNKYVDIVYTFSDASDATNATVATFTIPAGKTYAEGTWSAPTVTPTEDITYNVKCVITSTQTNNTTGEKSTLTLTDTAKVNVFKPTITFADDTMYLGESAIAINDNQTAIAWKHSDTLDTAVTMTGTKPTVTNTYAVVDSNQASIADNKLTPKVEGDIGVDVKTAIGQKDITSVTTFLHTNCSGKTCTLPEKAEFLVHVKTCSLTVTKENADPNDTDNNDTFVINVSGPNNAKYQVVLGMGDTATIKGLPVGTYTVTEDTNWAWRYTPSYKNGNTVTNEAELSKTTTSATIKVTNTKDTNNWLDYSDAVDNLFTKDGGKS